MASSRGGNGNANEKKINKYIKRVKIHTLAHTKRSIDIHAYECIAKMQTQTHTQIRRQQKN
jgi:hypothetical protein